MSASSLIRFGGLAAMVGGTLYFVGAILNLSDEGRAGFRSGFGYIFGGLSAILFVLLLMGAMAATLAIAALCARQRDIYGAFGMLAALAAFVCMALIFAGEIRLSGRAEIYGMASLYGSLLVSPGVLALGIVTIAPRELPWWCGVALIVWGLGFFWTFFVDLGYGPTGGTTLALLLGAPWVVVGYAVFRAAGQRIEQPSRVR
jgi:hypothetical protein